MQSHHTKATQTSFVLQAMYGLLMETVVSVQNVIKTVLLMIVQAGAASALVVQVHAASALIAQAQAASALIAQAALLGTHVDVQHLGHVILVQIQAHPQAHHQARLQARHLVHPQAALHADVKIQW